MNSISPPPILDSARVIVYAVVANIPYKKWGLLLIDGEPLEQVPKLAVCENLYSEPDILLFHCDEHWNVLGAIGCASVEEAKIRAEKNYPSVTALWAELDTSQAGL